MVCPLLSSCIRKCRLQLALSLSSYKVYSESVLFIRDVQLYPDQSFHLLFQFCTLTLVCLIPGYMHCSAVLLVMRFYNNTVIRNYSSFRTCTTRYATPFYILGSLLLIIRGRLSTRHRVFNRKVIIDCAGTTGKVKVQ